jgi:transcriptional regulator with XRE-family HTH domain
MQNIPYLVRRARLLRSQTQARFAEEFEVDHGTVSRWECGKLVPAPKSLVRILAIDRSSSIEGDEVVRASPVSKYMAHMDDLKHPCVASKGLWAALRKAGLSAHEVDLHMHEVAPASPFEVSAIHALELIQSDPNWMKRRVIYAEARCLSASFGWVNIMAAPFSHQPFALVEGFRCEEEDFWVCIVLPDDLPTSK